MKHSNYKLSEEQKRVLDSISDSIAMAIEDHCRDHEILNMYETPDSEFDNDKFDAVVCYIGDRLASF
jgi:hypothetical protein